MFHTFWDPGASRLWLVTFTPARTALLTSVLLGKRARRLIVDRVVNEPAKSSQPRGCLTPPQFAITPHTHNKDSHTVKPIRKRSSSNTHKRTRTNVPSSPPPQQQQQGYPFGITMAPSSKRPDFPPMPFSNAAGMDDCERPACAGIASAMKAFRERQEKENNQNESVPQECPPDSAALGRSSWSLLHSMAAWYPERPTQQDKTLMEGFFTALARFYPCTYCAQDFTEQLAKKPVE